ncbi:hypothetical protein GQ44DRAFT_706818 [Phaeosphaeriaceae sp. PMI808]|nr:hypothetical protein GQ44DRAFT_706818 [Phaeosphaeriaceae sp. PMI808]
MVDSVVFTSLTFSTFVAALVAAEPTVFPSAPSPSPSGGFDVPCSIIAHSCTLEPYRLRVLHRRYMRTFQLLGTASTQPQSIPYRFSSHVCESIDMRMSRMGMPKSNCYTTQSSPMCVGV